MGVGVGSHLGGHSFNVGGDDGLDQVVTMDMVRRHQIVDIF